MKTFPVFLKVENRKIVIVGGDETAAQKTRLALKTEARIVLVAETLAPELAALAAAERIEHHQPCGPGVFAEAPLAFIATGCPGADGAWRDLAKAGGASVVNVVDAPDLCDAFTPAIVDRDPVVVAIGTEGTAPVLARQIKSRIEEMLEPNLGGLAALAGRLRGAVAQRVAPERRRAFWRWVFAEAPRQSHGLGDETRAAEAVAQAIEAGGAPETHDGFVSLVGAGPGAKDLITLRGVKRLQEADVIYYDRLVDPEILELARRDAERVYVGKTPGAASWPQERINALIASEAKRGKCVVRLKCGDPSVFARAAEEIAALRAAGVDFDIVPGVTAASAAASALNQTLTVRGETDAVVLATATDETGAAASGAIRNATPGSSVAIYMGAAQARRIQQDLTGHGQPADLPIDVVRHASRANQTIIRSSLATLVDDMAREAVTDAAIIFFALKKPKRSAAAERGVATGAAEASHHRRSASRA